MPLSTEEFVHRVKVLDYMRALAKAQDEPERKQQISELLKEEEAKARSRSWAPLFD
jgi:hypothetical protein